MHGVGLGGWALAWAWAGVISYILIGVQLFSPSHVRPRPYMMRLGSVVACQHHVGFTTDGFMLLTQPLLMSHLCHFACAVWQTGKRLMALPAYTHELHQGRRACDRPYCRACMRAQNPGFDFSGATFNGQVPNPRTFMGGGPSVP